MIRTRRRKRRKHGGGGRGRGGERRRFRRKEHGRSRETKVKNVVLGGQVQTAAEVAEAGKVNMWRNNDKFSGICCISTRSSDMNTRPAREGWSGGVKGFQDFVLRSLERRFMDELLSCVTQWREGICLVARAAPLPDE